MNRKIYAIIATTVFFLLTACGAEGKKTENNTTNSIENKSTENPPKSKINQVINQSVFRLDLFAEVPAEIDGCSCLFSLDKEDWEKGKEYVFAGNLTDKGYMVIDGERQELKYSYEVSDKDEFDIIAENDQYSVHIMLQKVKNVDYTQTLSGNMQIQRKSDKTGKMLDVYGACGC